MTTYQPNPVVTFDGGIVYSENTIAQIQITNGRSDVMDQPDSGYARLVLWTDANTPLNVKLSDAVVIEIDKGTTGTAPIFTGIISDIGIQLANYGDIGSIAEYTITAVGPLAQLNKRSVGAAGYSKEFDGDRMYNILSDAFLTSWADVGATITWNDLPNGVTWDSYDATNESLVNNLATTIDRPGQYELTAYSDGATNALGLTDITAQSGRGVLYEAGDGHLHYADYEARTGQTPLRLYAEDILADGLRTAAQWSEIVNDVTVTYKANAEKYARDEQSVILYGQLTGSRQTILENATDAQSQANDFLSSRAYPRVYPESFRIALHNPDVSDATRDALIGAHNGLEIITDELPSVFGTSFNGFIEGYTWNLTRYTAEIDLICSAVSETYPHLIWYQIPNTTTWAGYNPTTEWSDL